MSEEQFISLVVETPWTLTPPYVGPGFNGQWLDPYLIAVHHGEARDPRVDADLNPHAPLKIGIAQYESMPVFLLQSPALRTIDIAHPWVLGAPEPEIVPWDAEHILWQLVVVQQGTITSMHAFTTNTHYTRTLRRIFAEQRAAGVLSVDEGAAVVDRWRSATPTEKDIWRRSLAQCQPGD